MEEIQNFLKMPKDINIVPFRLCEKKLSSLLAPLAITFPMFLCGLIFSSLSQNLFFSLWI